jgi:hypothetical protein
VPKIRWYGPQFGDGSTGDRVSHTTPVVNAVTAKAKEIGYKAAWLLDTRAMHRTGESQIRVSHHPATWVDAHVLLEDPNDKRAAAGIEKTHHVLQDAVDSV